MDPLFTILFFALLLSGAISFYEGVFGTATGWKPYLEPIGIAAAVLLATTVAHILESQNEKTFKSLNEVNDDTLVKVIRNNNVCQVPRKDVVVGDIVLLEAGEEVPADAELLECMNLTMNESSLTGEPQCTKTTNPDEFDKDATYPSNHIMKGCTVMEGDCIAKVYAVGDATACGKVFEAAQVKDGDATRQELIDMLNFIDTMKDDPVFNTREVGNMIYLYRGDPNTSDAVLVDKERWKFENKDLISQQSDKEPPILPPTDETSSDDSQAPDSSDSN